MEKINIYVIFLLALSVYTKGQDKSLVNTSESPYAKLHGVNIGDVKWTDGFWAERFDICKEAMVPHMLANYKDPEISHAFRNFEIAAGLAEGEHKGPPFHDGDFFKILEGAIMVSSVTKDEKMLEELDRIIAIIGKTQREDGYIHTPVMIEQLNKKGNTKEFAKRIDFETYNMGHLMTAACLHYRVTGKTEFLDIAKKAAYFLCDFYRRDSVQLAHNAICPSHYMGIVELYRTTRDTKYLTLAKNLIKIRSLVENGTDHNQDRIPFKQQTRAVGHAVRANYLYAGAADVYAETGDDSLLTALDRIWHDVTERKLYITGACGALYDGVSPDGTSYDPSCIQQVHQAYGRDYQLPNLTAHNESCANIGFMLWNWRMLQITGEAKYADMLEATMYNSLLAGVSLDGERYFYTNPLCVSDDITYTLRWSKEREEYISYCNCCPPNTIRTIAQLHNYAYSLSKEGLWVNLYGGNSLFTTLADGSELALQQMTDYPWNGNIKIVFEKVPEKEFSLFLRIPGWCNDAKIWINGKKKDITLLAGEYAEIKQVWKQGDRIELQLAMEAKMMEAHPLVEETRNQVAVKRGPVMYCLEEMDVPEGTDIFDITLPVQMKLLLKEEHIDKSTFISLEGEALAIENASWNNQLYREINRIEPKPVKIKLIPYYAWGNRGKGDMTVWLPISR